MSLYTTYRPKDWDSIVGQDYTTTILRNALKLDRVGHAYLFHGSRGTGKTTSARILAKAVNCTNLQNGNPCHECIHCKAFDTATMLDVIEIDAASNTGVDNIRDLIDKARFEPNQGKFKVYIIDEVHMLSTGAFNALLKILEEPPKHVKFILATTEIDKVPETIRSRTQRFDFRKIVDADIIGYLKYICKKEGIDAEEKALSLIARTARGGMRDAITLLEQNRLDDTIRFDYVKATLMIVDDERLDSTIEALREGNINTLLKEIETLRSGHIHTRSYIEQLLYRLRDILFEHIGNTTYGEYDTIFQIVMEAHGKLRSFPDGMMLIETTLLRALKKDAIAKQEVGTHIKPKKTIEGIKSVSTSSNDTKLHMETGVHQVQESMIGTNIKPELTNKGTSSNSEDSIITLEIKDSSQKTSNGTSVTKIPEPGTGNSQLETLNMKSATGNLQHDTAFSFSKLLQHLKGVKPALVSDLRNARFEIEGTVITFIFPTNWTHDRVNTSTVKHFLSEVLTGLFGNEWTIACKLETQDKPQLTTLADGIF